MQFWHNFHQLILSDPKGKIIALILACFLWYYVNVLSLEKTYLNLPIIIVNPPENLKLEYTKKMNVRVELQSREDISSYIKNLEAIVDLSEYTLGTKEYPIKINHLPPDIQLNITPQTLKITIYALQNKSVPIRLSFNKSPMNSFITNYTISPDKVTIIGKKELLNQVNFLKTEELVISNSFSDILQTNLKILSPRGIIVSQGYTAKISLFARNFNITNTQVTLPIDTKSLVTGFSIKNLPNIPLTIVSSVSNIEKLLLQTKISLELNEIKSAGKFIVPITITAPPELKILNPPYNIDIEIISNKNVQEFVNPIMDLINQSSEKTNSLILETLP